LAKLLIGNKHKTYSPRVLKILSATETVSLNLLVRFGRLFSVDRASRIGARLMRRLGPGLDKTRLIRRNLKLAFPHKSEAELDRLIADIWANLGRILAEYPHLETICHSQAAQYLEFVIPDDLEVFKNPAKPAVFVSAHLANWELAAGSIVQQGVPLRVVYTRLQNPGMDRLLYQAREGLGCGLIERNGAARKLIRCLKHGTSVGLIVDQRVDVGEPVPFFGHNMRSSITPAQLALRFGCELIPVQIQRQHDAHFRVIFHPAIKPTDENAPDEQKFLQMTAKINALFEAWIRERPAEWMCTKRRWPKHLVKPDWMGKPGPEEE